MAPKLNSMWYYQWEEWEGRRANVCVVPNIMFLTNMTKLCFGFFFFVPPLTHIEIFFTYNYIFFIIYTTMPNFYHPLHVQLQFKFILLESAFHSKFSALVILLTKESHFLPNLSSTNLMSIPYIFLSTSCLATESGAKGKGVAFH